MPINGYMRTDESSPYSLCAVYRNNVSHILFLETRNSIKSDADTFLGL